MPFYSEENEIVIKKIVDGDYNMDGIEFQDVSASAMDLIDKMLKIDPKERISVKEATHHDWILNKNFGAQKKDFIKKETPDDDSFNLQQFV